MEIHGFNITPQNGDAGTDIPISISVTSDNEGLDVAVDVIATCGDKTAILTLEHKGKREIFLSDDEVFTLADGGTFNVLKGQGDIPDVPVETYTRLSYIESTGEQYINTGYTVQEDDIIEMQYTKFKRTAVDEYMFGASDDNGRVWVYINSNSTYPRFGGPSKSAFGSTRWKNVLTLQKGSVSFDGAVNEIGFESLPQTPLYLFARNNNGIAESFATIKTVGVTITKASGEVVMKLRPCKRDTDGAVGMIDLVSGQFFPNQGSGATFSYGGEAHISAEYEILDYLTCANDKVFDTNVYSNETTYVELLFRRTNYAAAEYIYGCSSTSDRRFTAYLTTSGYWRHGSGYASINCKDGLLHYGYVTPSKITVDNSSRSFTISAYTSPFTIPVGGYKPATGVATPDYQGHMYYFRMWHGDEIVVDYMPCKRLSDGVEGFWDCVTQTFIEPLD